MYHQFNIQKFSVLPIQCIYVFCVDLRTNSGYFPIQHKLTGFYNRGRVFTARYGLGLRIRQIQFRPQGFNVKDIYHVEISCT